MSESSLLSSFHAFLRVGCRRSPVSKFVAPAKDEKTNLYSIRAKNIRLGSASTKPSSCTFHFFPGLTVGLVPQSRNYGFLLFSYGINSGLILVPQRLGMKGPT